MKIQLIACSCSAIKTGHYIFSNQSANMSGSESTKAPESYHPSLGIHRNLAYNILKYLEDDIVRDKEISALDQCSECFDEILTLPPKTFAMRRSEVKYNNTEISIFIISLLTFASEFMLLVRFRKLLLLIIYVIYVSGSILFFQITF